MIEEHKSKRVTVKTRKGGVITLGAKKNTTHKQKTDKKEVAKNAD